MLHSRILSSTLDLFTFRDMYFSLSGSDVSVEYLRRARVRAFFDKQGKMLAGYATNSTLPLRYESFVPAQERNSIEFFDNNSDHIVEGSCVWIERSLRNNASRAHIYGLAIYDFLRSGQRFILGGTNFRAIMRKQAILMNKQLYRGPDATEEGREIYIYYGTRVMMISNIIIYSARFLAGKRFGNWKIFSETPEIRLFTPE